MIDDLRAALRSLRQSPTFTAVALTVLALGIGAGTAIFSVVDAVVLRALPFDEHDRLAVVLEHDPKRVDTFGGGTTTPQTYLDWRGMQESFEGLAATSALDVPSQERERASRPTRARRRDVGVLSRCCASRRSSAAPSRQTTRSTAVIASRFSAMASGSGGSVARPMSSARRSN